MIAYRNTETGTAGLTEADVRAALAYLSLPLDLAAADLSDWHFEAYEVPDVVPRRLIPKSVVQERMHAIGKLGMAFTALNSNPIFFGRWFAPDWPNVYFDDEGLLSILTAIGCTEADIEAVTAP